MFRSTFEDTTEGTSLLGQVLYSSLFINGDIRTLCCFRNPYLFR